MAFAYIVRCNFTEPDREAAWNAWYGGPKIVQMLAQPYFLTCQRFRRAAGGGRDYLALWTVTAPEALKTRQYTSQWGFADWERYVTDWSRDLFDARSAPDDAFGVPARGSLHVVSFDGINADEAEAARATVAARLRGMAWLPIAGLDRHTPLIGLQTLPDSGSLVDRRDGKIQEAIYRPISELHRSAASQHRRADENQREVRQ